MDLTKGLTMNRKATRIEQYAPCIFSSIIVCFVILLLFVFKKMLFFGNNSLVEQDAYYQYVDFFCWYKDLLSGKNTLNYTFYKQLGGTAIPLFAYYLASPFNLLFFFFPKEKAPDFIDLLFVIKSAVASFCFSLYIVKRFKPLPVYSTVLGICYGLMEYNVAQCFNIMWLDGVYMLPFMALGIYYCISEKRIVPLSLATGLSILFNWYTGGINCLFSIALFLFEEFEIPHPINTPKERAKTFFTDSFRFALSLLLGVLLSSCLFLPSVIALRSGEGSSFDWAEVHNALLGSIFSVAQNNVIGSFSEPGSVSLFCGSFVVLTVIHLFRDKKNSLMEKLRVGYLLAFGVLIFIYDPLFFAFSLFKDVSSYWYRYSYVGCFIILYIAAKQLSTTENNYDNRKSYLLDWLIASGIIIIGSFINPKWDIKLVYTTVAFSLFEVCVFPVSCKKKIRGKLKSSIFVAICATELLLNAYFIVDNWIVPNMNDTKDKYAEYITNLDLSINDIHVRDQGYYRISQTVYRGGTQSYAAAVNDSMANGFAGITGYSSLSENIQTNLESNMGYNCWAENLQVVRTSIIPTDSLLGVKYVISNYPIQGLINIGSSPLYAECNLYENPYVLPIVFSVNGIPNESDSLRTATNPFEYINALYSDLIGERIVIFKPVPYLYSSDGNIDTFNITSSMNDSLYGLVNKDHAGVVSINGREWFSFGEWQSQTLFYIPYHSDCNNNVIVSIESSTPGAFYDSIFYKIDFSELQRATRLLIDNDSVENLVIEDGNVTCCVNADSDTYLQTSIPLANGWTAYVNGNKTEIIPFADGLIRIPLQEGINNITLKYQTPGIVIGMLLSSVAALSIVLLGVIEHRRKSQGFV